MVLVDELGFSSKELKEPKRYKAEPIWWSVIKNTLLVLFFSAIVFVLINMPAYFLISKYKINPQSIAKIEPPKEQGGEISRKYDDNTLYIEKIGVKAPIKWDTTSSEINDSLERGLVHIVNTGKPGENRNIFITGHSSNYWWKAGDYNSVFALLPELKENDEIYLTYKGQIKKFKVSETIELKKKEVSSYVNSSEEKLTLMTCYPVGTNLKRFLVIAKPF